MTNLTRSNGGQDAMSLRAAMDRLIEDSFVRFNDMAFGLPGAGAPLLNVYETDDDVVIQALLPGIKAEELDITLTGDTLTIKGETKQKRETKNATYHRQEWHQAAFERTVVLPTEVNPDAVRSEYENGVLTLTLPKAEAVKPKRLQIKAH